MYTPKPEVLERIHQNFTYHKPLQNQPERYERLRAAAGNLAGLFVTNAPDSRELAVALTKLEEAVFWVNAAIARNEKEKP